MNLKSNFALLSLLAGRARQQINRMMPKGSENLPAEKRIPVVIRGFITHRWSGFDGIDQEFGIAVTSVEIPDDVLP